MHLAALVMLMRFSTLARLLSLLGSSACLKRFGRRRWKGSRGECADELRGDPGLRCNLDMGASGDERLWRVMDDLEMGLGRDTGSEK